MRRQLARVLWISAVAGMALNCGKTDKTDKTDKADEADKTTSPKEEVATEVAPPADPNMPSPVAVVDMKDSESANGAPNPGLARAPMATGRTKGKRAMISGARIAPRPYRGPPTPTGDAQGTEDYKNHGTNPMVDTATDNLSTFAVDVDTAAYAIARSKLLGGSLPPQAAVRVEEFVNYFGYSYASPDTDAPFAVHMDAAPSPFTKGRHILRVGVQAKKLAASERKNAHLVFLVDVSGSMGAANKLPLAKRAMRVMVENLKAGDTVALVTYAGNTRVVLEPTGIDQKGAILSALEDLNSGGSTAMSSGIDLAYELAVKKLSSESISRVIVLSDGDANIGASNHDAILKQISGKVKEGVTLTTVGFGRGNYKDHLMEQLANKGNGNYFYIDTISEARKVFQEQLGGTLEVVAKDVKIQVDFDKNAVRRYRLVGYENRDVADRDFRNDKVDAGEIGAGHSVTAIYEVELAKSEKPIATVRLRAKKPRGETATEWAFAFDRSKLSASFDGAEADFRFATAVAGGAEILRGSEHATNWGLDKVIKIASGAASANQRDRSEFVKLMKRARSLKPTLAAR